jgi:hypothetical protein
MTCQQTMDEKDNPRNKCIELGLIQDESQPVMDEVGEELAQRFFGIK